MYKCTIKSNSSYPREYTMESKSAMKAAELWGRAEGGEVITVTTMGGKRISRVMWVPDNGGKYIKVEI